MFRYLTLLALLCFLRGCDFYSTSLWFFQENGHASETNPLVSVLGLGWNSLVIANLLMVMLVAVLLYFYCFDRSRIRAIRSKASTQYTSIWDFASDLYFDRRDWGLKVLYKFSNNKRITLAHAGYVLATTLAFASCVATTHNLLSYYRVAFYTSLKASMGHILYLYYVLFALFAGLALISALKEEYKTHQLLAAERGSST